MKIRTYIQEEPQDLKARIVMMQMRNNKAGQSNKEDERYFYTCCVNGFESQGCQAFCHIEKRQIDTHMDELYKKRRILNAKWERKLSNYQ
jgi:hypothetical protein